MTTRPLPSRVLSGVAPALIASVVLAGPGASPGASSSHPTGRVATVATSPTTPAAPGDVPGARWTFPLTPRPRVLAPFAAPPGPYAAGHRGVDLAATVGAVVRSPTDGVVAFAGTVAGRHVLVVTHAAGLRSTLEPVTATLAVGSRVRRGDPVGTVDAGPGHCPPATCLHWGVLRGPTYLDPLRMVSRPRVVLLPLDP